jgi:hypothetical protein
MHGWKSVRLSDSAISSETPGYSFDGQVRLTRKVCEGAKTSPEPNRQQMEQTNTPKQSAPSNAPQSQPQIDAGHSADDLLSNADRLLGGTNAVLKTKLSYVSFANHGGLNPDSTWGACISASGQNEAASCALRSCTVKLSVLGDQCGSAGSCTLKTGAWAAYAVSTGPLMGTTGGIYPIGTACGSASQAAAQTLALQNCQASQTTCTVVWTIQGK